MKVLIVDDLETNRRVLRLSLEADGLQTLEAKDGRQALEVLEREAVDCVITDIMMPVMNGYRLCQEIRASKSFCSVPIIVYTCTYTTESEQKLALEVGADVFLPKPVPIEVLCKTIRDVTTRQVKREIKHPHPDAVSKQFNDALIRKLEERNVQLEQEQEKFRQITESIQEVFWITNQDLSQIIYISPAYEKIWGRTCESLYKSPNDWNDAVHPDDRERTRLSAAVQSAQGSETEYRILRPDGSLRWIRNRSFPIKDAKGEVYRLTGVAADITEEKQLAVQFQQAQKMEAMGRLAGGVAHDFNNLLTSIMGLCDLSLKELADEHPIRPDLEEIKATGNRAAKLTQQLLAFSRRQVFEPQALDMNELVRNAEKMLTRIIGEDVEFTLRLAPAPCPVRVDPSQVEQVLVNLCVNARDAMPKGGRLVVETGAAAIGRETLFQGSSIPAGDYATLRVSDSGDGMSAEVKAHLFEPFFTTKPVGKRTGLGLPTCFGIIKQSRGFIQVESELGKGSRFTVYLPLSKEEARPPFAPQPREDTARGEETLLVTEDEPAVRRLTCRLLRAAGYTLLEAANGEEALKLAAEDRQKAIRLLVTDVVMPLMNGRELADELRALRPDIKVLFISGYPDETLSQEGVLEAGVLFLRKPFTEESLTRKVREALDRGAGVRA